MNGIYYTNDPRAVLIHFNPNHDKLGRFAKSRFSGSKNLTKSANVTYNKNEETNTIDKERLKKYAKIGAGLVAGAIVVGGGIYLAKSGKLDSLIRSGKRATQDSISAFGSVPVDDIAGEASIKKLSKPETIMECMKNTNPNHNKSEYKGNCTSCVMAAFMRMCGYDVKAGKVRGGQQDLITAATRCFDFDIKTNTIREKANEFGRSPERAAQILVEKFGKNASGAVGVKWMAYGDKMDGESGHAFNFIIKNGVVEFFDTQRPDLDLNDFAIRNNYWPLIHKDSEFSAVRLDNAEPIFDFLSLELET